MRNSLSSLALAAAALAAAGSLAFAHPPGHRAQKAQPAPQPKAEAPGSPGRNLQVLPADIPQARLLTIMRHWGQALGVQCSYCHVPGNFPSDANPHKNVARGMVRMTNRINNELLPPVVGVAEQPRVNCYSCHRGSPFPETQLPEPPPAAPARPQPEPDPRRNPLPAHIAPDTPAKPH
jgi:hypothetical protein